MRRNTFIIGLLVYFWAAAVYCLPVEIILKGRVTLQNSGGKPLQGVHISAPGAVPVFTDKSGKFKLNFNDKNPDDTVILTLEKQGLEVVDPGTREVALSIEPNQVVHFAMCPKGDQEKNAVEYKGIIRESIDNIYKKRLKEIEQTVSDSKEKKKSILFLEDHLDLALTLAKELGKKLALVNLNRVSQLYREAFIHFRGKEIQKALDILADEEMDRALPEAKKKRKKSKEAVYACAADYMLKARLSIANFQLDQAQTYYQKAIDAEQDHFDFILEFFYYIKEQSEHLNSAYLSITPLPEKFEKEFKKIFPDSTRPKKLPPYLLSKPRHHYRPLFLELIKKVGIAAKTSSQKAKQFIIYGDLFQDSRKYKAALQAYEKALEIFEKLAADNPQLYLIDVKNILEDLCGDYKMDKIPQQSRISYNKKLLKVYEKLNLENPKKYWEGMTRTLSRIGDLYLDKKQYKDARLYYKEAIKNYEKMSPENPNFVDSLQLASILNKMAEMSYKAKNLIDARYWAGKELKARKKMAQEKPDNYILKVYLSRNLSRLAYYNQGIGIYSDASVLFKEALEIEKKLAKDKPKKHLPIIGGLLCNLGSVYSKYEEYNDALLYLKEGLEINKKLAAQDPKHHSILAINRKNLGVAYRETGQFKNALSCFQGALKDYEKLAEKSPGKFDLVICTFMLDSCLCYSKLLNQQTGTLYKKKAMALVNRVFTILNKHPNNIEAQKYKKKATYWKEYFEKK